MAMQHKHFFSIILLYLSSILILSLFYFYSILLLFFFYSHSISLLSSILIHFSFYFSSTFLPSVSLMTVDIVEMT